MSNANAKLIRGAPKMIIGFSNTDVIDYYDETVLWVTDLTEWF